LDGLPSFGISPKIKKKTESQISHVLTPAVAQKSSYIKDEYKQLSIFFHGNYQLTFRAYNDGVAYRFSTSLKNDVIVVNESFNLNFSDETFLFIS